MKTHLACIPCFFRQILEGARYAGISPQLQKKVMDEFARAIPQVSLRSSPPEIALIGYGILKKVNADRDPYKAIKQKSNRLALKLYRKLKRKAEHSKDRLLKAVELAIAGNIIDFGAKNNLDINDELKKILSKEETFVSRRKLFHYRSFKKVLKKSKTILYLADNAGEIVFDRILIEEIKRIYPEKVIYVSVKDKPVINDALMEDALFCGVDKTALLISNGADAPGTILPLCSKEFKRIYMKADMIISKGQGNFESLSRARKHIFFLFMVKCPVVAEETGRRLGDIVLLDNRENGPFRN
ncbi:MAG: DUF89 family protein [Candidatus Aureabacteria bacterium]|nr:DUF89 family protein [Candidatus Auribacterota bacterium]